MCTGVAVIDSDHRQLYELARQLVDALNNGKGNLFLSELLDQLLNSAVLHFDREENLMHQIAYSDYALHKSEHDAIVSAVIELKHGLMSYSVTLSVRHIHSMLTDWLHKHLESSDLRLSAALHQHLTGSQHARTESA